MLWSGLYPSKKHLTWLLCSDIIIHDRLTAARGALYMHSADPAAVSCALRHVRVIKQDIDVDHPATRRSSSYTQLYYTAFI